MLLAVGSTDFDLAPDQLASRLLSEIGIFAAAGSSAVAMSAEQFASARPSIALTLQLLCKGAPVPDDSLRSAMKNFLTRQYNTVVTNIRQASAVQADATPAGPATDIVVPAAVARPATSSTDEQSLRSVVVALQRKVSSLVDHINSGASPSDLGSVVAPALPAYIAKAFERPDLSLTVVPDCVSDALHAKDLKYSARLAFTRSIMNKGGRKVHPDIDAYIQKNFCSPQMSYCGYESRISGLARRKSVIGQKLDIQDDVRTLLDVRIQRHRAQKRNLGDAISLQEIESLKTREFRLFSEIRTRLNIMFATDTDGKSAVASVVASGDTPFVRAALGATTGQAKSLLAALQKSAMKRPPPSKVPHGPDQKIPRLRGNSRACKHCGASGKKYHPYYKCTSWMANEKPAAGSAFAKKLASGKTVPVFKKKPKA